MTKEDIQRWEATTKQISEVNIEIAKWAGHSKSMGEDVKEISTIVRGNGNPEHGMVYKLQDLEHKFTTCQSNGMTKNEIKEAITEAFESKPNDKGDERRKNSFQRMQPKNKILIGIAIAGFVFTYAVQIYSVAEAVFNTLVTK